MKCEPNRSGSLFDYIMSSLEEENLSSLLRLIIAAAVDVFDDLSEALSTVHHAIFNGFACSFQVGRTWVLSRSKAIIDSADGDLEGLSSPLIVLLWLYLSQVDRRASVDLLCVTTVLQP